MADARQARDNRAFVRRLLREKQPGFAAVLELAERDLPGREPPVVMGATGGSAIIACLSEGLGWPDLNIVHGL